MRNITVFLNDVIIQLNSISRKLLVDAIFWI